MFLNLTILRSFLVAMTIGLSGVSYSVRKKNTNSSNIAKTKTSKKSADSIRSFKNTLRHEQKIKSKSYDIRLINLNPYINKWFILEFDGKKKFRLHLENTNHLNHLLITNSGIKISRIDRKEALTCDLWKSQSNHILLFPFTKKSNPFFSICEDQIYVRLKRLSKTKLSLTEWSTDLLRSTSFGESIINSLKPFIVNFSAESGESRLISFLDSLGPKKNKNEPKNAEMNLKSTEKSLVLADHKLGMNLKSEKNRLFYGKWYETSMHSGVFVSIFIPGHISQRIKRSHPEKVNKIQTIEADKLVYLSAYDLSRYHFRYAVGTREPPIHKLEGGEGELKGLAKSLVGIGSIPPYEIEKAIGVFIGGFKFRHSKIKRGPHKGKRYGYIENGVELSPMQAGLASIYTTKSGHAAIERWPTSSIDEKELRKTIISARQNGTLLIEGGTPGKYVNNWANGNWSADAKGLRQSLRSGICIQHKDQKSFLLFMAFTSATPSTMTKVMEAYHCDNGMHLDMNAHMYLHNAIYEISDDKNKMIRVEYLNQDMLYPPKLKRHRFIMDNNSRDFFYVLPKKND